MEEKEDTPRILLCTEDIELVDLLTHWIHERGWAYTLAGEIQAARRKLGEGRINVVMICQANPQATLRFCAQLRDALKEQGQEELPLLSIGDVSNRSVLLKLVSTGVGDFLVRRDLDREALFDRLDRLLGRRVGPVNLEDLEAGIEEELVEALETEGPGTVIRALVEVSPESPEALSSVKNILSRDPPLLRAVTRVGEVLTGLNGKGPSDAFEGVAGRLGAPSMRHLAIGAAIFRAFTSQCSSLTLRLLSFPDHSVAVALLAHRIAGKAPGLDPIPILAAALVHDIGIPILAARTGDRYGIVCATVRSKRCEIHLAEDEALGIDHLRVGGILSRTWHLPDPFSESLQAHQELPSASPIDPGGLVALADAMARDAGFDLMGESHTGEICGEAAMALAGLSMEESAEMCLDIVPSTLKIKKALGSD